MTTSRPVCWLLSPYLAGSHGWWADWLLSSQPQYEWHRLELPGRFFRWRIRGNPLSWLDALPSSQPDLIVASSMTDIATIRGLHARLAGVPVLYYFHENQFAYPLSSRQPSSIDPQIVQLYGALSAQRVAFNSAYNRDTFLHGIEKLLARLPDAIPDHVVERIADKSSICPVVIDDLSPPRERDDRLIVWNHRWEYDKNPQLFTDAMLALAERGMSFQLALLGARPGRPPRDLVRLRENLPSRIVADGHLPRAEYRRLLASAAVAVSTARHEFQGLAMLEAASAGVRPLAPDDLCYVEQYPAAYRYPAGQLTALVERLSDWLGERLPAAVDVSGWKHAALAGEWRKLLHATRNE
jgi:glycosyltransferase involved in cell wall biosynthesis